MSEKMARKLMAHFVDSTFGGETASWYRLGEDFEEYSVEMNPDVETSKNILGNTTFTHNGYEISADGDPFYAREGDALFEKLQTIIDTQAQYTGLKTKALEAHLWDAGTTEGTYKAFTQDCYVVPTSYGGDTSGYQIPFTVYYVGDKTAGTYNLSAGTFTPTT
jgi:hypothetical protein